MEQAEIDSLLHFFYIDSHRRNHIAVYCQTEFNSIDRIKKTFFILLQILIISQRQTFGCNQHRLQMPINTTCFTTHKLGNIRIFFLRHHR